MMTRRSLFGLLLGAACAPFVTQKAQRVHWFTVGGFVGPSGQWPLLALDEQIVPFAIIVDQLHEHMSRAVWVSMCAFGGQAK